MHHFINCEPHHRLRDLAKKHGPLMHLQLGEIPTLIVSTPEAAREVLKNNDINFAQRPPLLCADVVAYGCTDVVFSPYGNYWQQLRKMCITQLMTPKSVQSFRGIREEEVSKFVSLCSSRAKGTINISKGIFSMMFDITTRSAFGEIMKDQKAFLDAIEEGLEVGGGFTVADMFPSFKYIDYISGAKRRLEAIHRKVDGMFDEMINEHKNKKPAMKKDEDEEDHKDLLDLLLEAQKNGDHEFTLSNDNIKAVIVDIFTAGSDTSASTVEWTMSELIKNPSVMAKAQAELRNVFRMKGTVDEDGLHELKYLKAVIKESMRLHPAAALLLPRECRKSCEIFGYEIPVKTRVLVNSWAIGRDPNYWSEAEKFNPERFIENGFDYKGAPNLEFIPFGAGRRVCPGIGFAIANVELPLAHLLYHFDWKLPNGQKNEDLDMTDVFGLTVGRKDDLILVPIPHLPQPVG
ncbi:premnaspirodiene oxygenase-like [Pistacia vera]|uniref:premnaspirodiene oxygenase-like n=1 Tax=Pistacia vera TaxID=55513 RepID=UPI0012630593|nr:premnaspirodiene oxygenase-like [Pistacia vera]